MNSDMEAVLGTSVPENSLREFVFYQALGVASFRMLDAYATCANNDLRNVVTIDDASVIQDYVAAWYERPNPPSPASYLSVRRYKKIVEYAFMYNMEIKLREGTSSANKLL